MERMTAFDTIRVFIKSCRNKRLQFIQERFASEYYVVPGFFEVTGVPRIGDLLPFPVRVIQQEADLAIGISAGNMLNVSDVGVIHADDEIIMRIILLSQLPCPMTHARYAVLFEHPSRGRIHGISDLLSACRGGRDLKAVAKSPSTYKVLHNIFGHGTAADIAMADK